MMRILEVNTLTGATTRIAGGSAGFSGEGSPAINAHFDNICDMEGDADGSLYVLCCKRAVLQRIAPAGPPDPSTPPLLLRVAGTGTQLSSTQVLAGDPTTVPLQFSRGFPQSGEGGGIGLDGNGGVYIAQTGLAACSVLYLDTGGRLSSVVPGTSCNRNGATRFFTDVAFSSDVGLVLAQQRPWPSVVRFASVIPGAPPAFEVLAGKQTTLNAPQPTLPNVFPAKIVLVMGPAIHFGSDGLLYVAESAVWVPGEPSWLRIFKLNVRSLAAKRTGTQASADGSEIYEFDEDGKHVFRLGIHSRARICSRSPMMEMACSRRSRMSGQDTTIERDVDGIATAIVAPFGQRTELDCDRERLPRLDRDEP